MRRETRSLVFALAMLSAGVAWPAPALAPVGEVLAGPVPARIVEVLDGDTVVVRARIWLGQKVAIRVRLAGIDAPELRGRCARERRLAKAARALLAETVAGGEVRLTEIRYGKYAGRVVARLVTAAGADPARLLLEAGLARTYDGRRRRPWCGKVESRR